MAKNKETAEDVRPGARESAVVVPAIGTLSPVKRTALIPDQTGAERTLADSSQKAVRDFARQVETLPPASHSEPRHHVDDGVGGDGPNQGGDLTTKDKRRSRWQLDFQVTGPIDHLRQFAALGAILAVPEPQGGYRVFKDLHSWPGLKAPMLTEGRYPPGEHVDTLADIHWICFTDREPKTVAEVASVLGAPAAPYLLAFFPNELQEKMARLERQFHHRREEDIHSKTYFKVVPRGSGYAVVIDRSQAASP